MMDMENVEVSAFIFQIPFKRKIIEKREDLCHT